MTKDLVALSNRARSIAIVAVFVAGATLITGPAPARAIARGFGGIAIPDGLATRLVAFRPLSSRRRRRRRDAHPVWGTQASHRPPQEAPEAAEQAAPDDVGVEPVAEHAAPPEVHPEPVAEQAAPDDVSVEPVADQAAPETGHPVPVARAMAANGSTKHGTGLQAGAPVIGYVTTPEHAVSGDLSPTERAIEQACERAGWKLVAIVRDPEGGRILDRPGLSHALEQIADGQAEGLVVNDARLLSRSLDFAGLVHWFRDAEAALIALDLGLDTSTPEGSRVASTLITINGWAGERIARRATVAVAARPEVLERVAAMHRDDMPLHQIAERLNAEGVVTPSGSEVWWPSTVQTALRYWRAQARAPVEELSLERRASG
jgi:hypothetical protein